MRPSATYSSLRVALLAVGAAACLSVSAPVTEHFGSGPRRLLFVGNSLTGANEMPGMLVALAESARVTPLPSADVDWMPDYALIDHWNLGNARQRIAGGGYDVVILQQGPSSVEVNRDTLRLAAKLFAPVIRSTGGLPALLSVWPTSDRLVDFDRATESYRIAASDVGGMHIPGGETWRAAWRRNPALAFYSPDGLHPTRLGSYAVALAAFGMLYERSTVGLPASIRLADGSRFGVDTATAHLLQVSVDEAVQRFGIKGSR
jgi:hypothetical protein